VCENGDDHTNFQRIRKLDLVERPIRDERRFGNGFATLDFSPAAQYFEFSHGLAAEQPAKLKKTTP
jgi:hypothetical protein